MRTVIGFIIFLGFVFSTWPAEAPEQINQDYEDINHEGSTWLDKNGLAWDLTRCDLNVSYTLDMSGYYPPFKKSEWSMVGIGSGAWAWMTSGAPSASVTNPGRNDMDDKLHLGSLPNKYDETSYDVLYPNQIVSDPIGDPWSNFGIWFDRDGVAKGQEKFWGLKSGATFDTEGIYDVKLDYHAVDDSQGTVFSTVNGIRTGFYNDWRDGIPEYYPVGMSFSGDLTNVKVFASVWGENVKVTDIQATGCLSLP
jgi:hypothetical protein